jgi:hypothetical protein
MRNIAGIFVILFLVIESNCQSAKIEDGWKGLRGLSTGKDRVDRKLGKPTPVDDKIWTVYSLPEAQVAVIYSSKPCCVAPGEKGDFEVPENTILEYIVSPKQRILLKELNWTPQRYKQILGAREPDIKNYENARDAVLITTSTDNGIETVASFTFTATVSERDKKLCPSKSH